MPYGLRAASIWAPWKNSALPDRSEMAAAAAAGHVGGSTAGPRHDVQRRWPCCGQGIAIWIEWRATSPPHLLMNDFATEVETSALTTLMADRSASSAN
jgi:hypothetical protein